MYVADNIVLVLTDWPIDATLEVGSVGSEVNVQANAAVIDTDSAKIAGTFTKQRFEEAPWVGDRRDPQVVMATLLTRCSRPRGWAHQVAGLSNAQTQTAMDGVAGDGGALQTANVSALWKKSTWS